MDKFVKIKIHGKPEQFFIVDYTIMDAAHKVIEGGVGSLPPCPELVANIRDWRSAYKADVRYARLEVVGNSVTNSSDINHYELTNNLKTNLNNWLSSPEFLPVRDKLMAGLNPREVVLVGIDINDVDLKYAPWHLWDFFNHFPKSDYALLRPNFSRVDHSLQIRKNQDRSSLNIMAIIGDSTGINTGEDTTIIRNLPGVNRLQILSEPSKEQVHEALWDSGNVDILFFAGHGRKDQDRGKICINGRETLGVEEMRSGLQKRIQEGLQLAIFNSCDGLELGEAIENLSIPQAIVMKEAVPDIIAQRFLKDFLKEFSAGVPLVQAFRQTRKKLVDQEDDYPYASWLPVLYCNPTEPLMQWDKPNMSPKYPWQTKLAVSCLLVISSIAGIGFLPQVYGVVNNPLEFTSNSLSQTYKDQYFQLNYPQNWKAQEELDGITGDIASILLSDNREVRLTVNIRDLTSTPLSSEGWRKQLLEDLEKYAENVGMIKQEPTTLALRRGYKIVFTTTQDGKTYKKVVITALKNNKAYSIIYSAPEDLFAEHEVAAREIISSLKLSN